MIELTLAIIVLLIGCKGLLKTLKNGSIETMIKKAKETLEFLEETKYKKGVFAFGWLIAVLINIFFITVALLYLVKLV